MQLLGVFDTIYGAGAEMTIDKALTISLVGFLIVFLILGILAFFVKAMGGVFDKINAKAADKKKLAAADTAISTSAPAKGVPLAANTSAGSLTLTDVTEEEAAVIMAIVSNKSGIPLNRLQFNSIKLKEDK